MWRLPGMASLVLVSLAGFTGYSGMLPVGPLWAVHGGADAAGAGLVNGLLLVATIITQLLVPSALHRFGWRPVLVVGMVLLGAPALLYQLSDALAPVLALSIVRGVGFGVLTVTGSAAAGLLTPPERRGEAIGVYGLAVAVPNLFFLPLAPWMAQNLGYPTVFLLSAAPLLGIPAAIGLGRAVEAHPESALVGGSPARASSSSPAGASSSPSPDAAESARAVETAGYRALLRHTFVLFTVTLAGGALLTFTPQMVSSSWLTAAGLFVMGLVAAATRWRAGLLADRYGAQRFVWPLVVISALGMGVVGLAVTDTGSTPAALFLFGMVLVGMGYGALQNLTLILAFASVSRSRHNLASAVWNTGFDAGTAAGSVLVGAIAAGASFSSGILVAGVLTLASLPFAFGRARRQSAIR